MAACRHSPLLVPERYPGGTGVLHRSANESGRSTNESAQLGHPTALVLPVGGNCWAQKRPVGRSLSTNESVHPKALFCSRHASCATCIICHTCMMDPCTVEAAPHEAAPQEAAPRVKSPLATGRWRECRVVHGTPTRWLSRH